MTRYKTKSRDWKVPFAPGLSFPSQETPYFRAYAESADPLEQIRIAADLGFRAVFDSYLMLRTPEQQSRIGEELARLGMVNAGIIFAPDTMRKPLWSGSTPDEGRALEQQVVQAIAAAKRGGARKLCVLTARRRFVPCGQQLYAFGDNLRRLAPLLAQEDVELCIEPACPELAPQVLIQRLLDAYVVVRTADSPAVTLMFDVYHIAMTEGDVIGSLKWVADRTGAIQLSDTARLEPGSGALNFPRIIETALQSGYRGYFELEHLFSTPSSAGLDLALQRLVAVDRAVCEAGV